MAIGLVVIRDRELFYGPRFSRDVYSFCRILSPYRRPFASSARTHMRFAFPSADRFCGAPPHAPSWPGVFYFRARFRTSKQGLIQGDRDGLAAAFPPGPLFNWPCLNSCMTRPVVFLWRVRNLSNPERELDGRS
jgi:hypothetical protein